jgi:hypothetical protein
VEGTLAAPTLLQYNASKNVSNDTHARTQSESRQSLEAVFVDEACIKDADTPVDMTCNRQPVPLLALQRGTPVEQICRIWPSTGLP